MSDRRNGPLRITRSEVSRMTSETALRALVVNLCHRRDCMAYIRAPKAWGDAFDRDVSMVVHRMLQLGYTPPSTTKPLPGAELARESSARPRAPLVGPGEFSFGGYAYVDGTRVAP
jgi:hypothetical protein